MGASLPIAPLLISSFFAFLIPLSYSSPSYSSPSHHLPIGAHPLDEKLYVSEVIKCKDGSNSFTRDRINDNYCDCLDGTDEPGTSACPAGKFYCRNVGSMPKFLFSSHVNDGICDCCDGSDEYHGVTVCPNSCVMGGNSAYHSVDYSKTYKRQSSADVEKSKIGLNTKDAFDKLKDLKVFLILQVVVIIIAAICWRFRRGGRLRRRHFR